jgi:peptidoglycan LD-endopeptidase LytH
VRAAPATYDGRVPRFSLSLRTARGSLLAGVALGLFGSCAVLGLLVVRAVFFRSTAPAAARSATDSVAEPSNELRARNLQVPVRGITRESLTDTFTAPRGLSRVHHAIDIMAPRGTPVVAVDGGTLVRLDSSGAGGIALYQYDAAVRYCYYYAHLDGYAPGVAAGLPVARGQVLGYVGSTGNATPSAPHLHFAITEIDATAQSCHGRAVNPYPLLR